MSVKPDTSIVEKGLLMFRAENGYQSSVDYLIIDTTIGPVVLVVDGPNSAGSSPTNSAEFIASKLIAKFDLPINQVIIEVYPDVEYRITGDWSIDLVQFKEFDGKEYQGPNWRPLVKGDPLYNAIQRIVKAEYGK